LSLIENTVCWGVDVTGGLSGGIIELDVFTDDLAERLIGLGCLQPAVEVDRGLDIAVTEQAPHDLVLAGKVLEIDRGTGVSELMDGHPQTRRLLDALRDLGAEHVRRLRFAGDAGEQPASV